MRQTKPPTVKRRLECGVIQMLLTKEHYELLSEFERTFKGKRLDREQNKELWKKGQVYENGEVNDLYKAFILGYTLGKAIERERNLVLDSGV